MKIWDKFNKQQLDAKVRKMYSNGNSMQKIGKEVGMSASSVYYILKGRKRDPKEWVVTKRFCKCCGQELKV